MSQPSDAPSQVTPQTFKAQLASLTSQLAGRPLDAALDVGLNTHHGAGSRTYLGLEAACRAGAAAGWLCDREGDGRPAARTGPPSARDVRWCSTFCPKGRSSSRADIHSPRECAGDMR